MIKNTIENTLKAVRFTKIEFFKINESYNLELKDLENDKRLPKIFYSLKV